MLHKSGKNGAPLRLLVPTDFSGSGINAAAFAIELFHKKTGEMILENVFQTPKENTGTLIQIGDIISKESKTLLEKERRHLKAEYKGVHISVHSEEGTLVHTIRKALLTKEINLLVLGIAKSAHSISRTANSFIEHPLSWPLLLVPHKSVVNKSKELIVILSEEGNSENGAKLAAYLKDINMHDNKTHSIKFNNKENIAALKQKIEELLKRHKVGLVVFNTSHGDRLQKAITHHEFDSLILSTPTLLIQGHDGA